MAVTIISGPGTHTPAYNHQNFVVSSNNSSQPNFRYISEIFVDGVSDPIRRPFNKRPDNSWAYIQCAEVTRDYVRNEFYPTITDFQISLTDSDARGAIKRIDHIVSEEYGSPVSGFPGATGTYYVWNANYNSIEFASFVYASTTSALDLTLSPSLTDHIHFNQRVLYKTWHSGFSSRVIRNLNIIAYDSAGLIIQQSVIQNAYPHPTPYRRYYIMANMSPYGLNNFSGLIVSKFDPSADIIPPSTYKYTFYFDDGAGPPQTSSATNTVYIDIGCSKYDRYVLHFLNRRGNYDPFTFTKVNRKPKEKESQSYKKIPFSLNSSNEYTYDEDTADTVVYSTTITNKHILNTRWLSEAEALWLSDLIMSSDIRMEYDDGTTVHFYAVKCTLKSYEPKQKVNDKLIQITIELEYDLQDTRQRS
jgi:hypothetical protein